MAKAVTIVDIRSLSYTGTTWINLLLGCHERGFALGPPDRVLRLLEDSARVDDAGHPSAQADDACRVHAAECSFWPRFFADYDRKGNFFLQLAAAADKDFIVINNPEGAGPAARHLADRKAGRKLRTRKLHVVRDGRAVCHSYRGYYPDTSFREVVEKWFHPSASTFPFGADDSETLNVRYEDVVADQRGFLGRAEAFLGIEYPENVTRFWEFDHHTTAGNTGTIGIVRRFLGKNFRKRDRAFQEERYERLLADPEQPVIDTRWETGLERNDRILFDSICGDYNERWGYARDRFEPAELAEHAGVMFGKRAVTAPSIKPYRVEDSGLTAEAVCASVNDQIFQCYGSDYDHGGEGKIVVGPLFDFELLLRGLTAHPHFDFVTHRDLIAEPCPADRVRVGFRHDVDADIVAAIEQAELQQQYGVKATWYILHTAPYYGSFKKGVFQRHDAMAAVYRRFQELGHEVALHTDPLMIYQTHGIDGAEAVTTEIEWLRSRGIDIHGTVAHNSKPVYGAWNYEIFSGRFDPEHDGEAATAPEHVVHDGKWAPLRVLDESALGLEYEGNEVFWQDHTKVEYGATRFVDRWRWNAHNRRRRADPALRETPFIDQARMLDDIAEIPAGRYLVLVVHPCYYGNRRLGSSPPALRARDVRAVHNRELGWYTYDPARLQCFDGSADEEQAFQAINKPNAMGMLDMPWPVLPTPPETLSVVLLGGDNVDGLPVAIPAQVQCRLSDLLREYAGCAARVHKLAFPGMGLTRLWAWYERTKAHLRPDVVVLGISADAAARNADPRRAAGEHLAWKRRSQRIVSAPAVRPRRIPDPPAPTEAFAASGSGAADSTFLSRVYEFACDRIRADGAQPLLLVEELGESRGRSTDPDGGADAALAWIESIATATGAPLVNPYPAFAEAGKRLPAHHRTDPRWNATGHRLAADRLFVALRSIGLVPDR